MSTFETVLSIKGKKENAAVQGTDQSVERKNHARIPTQLNFYTKQSAGLSFDNARTRYNSDLPMRPDARTYIKENQMGISSGQKSHLSYALSHQVSESSAGKRVVIIQRMRQRVHRKSASNKGHERTVKIIGKTVIMNSDLFDPDLVDGRKRTNVQRMEQGLAPIGRDGKSVQLHHIDQTDDGPVMEITATDHQRNYSILHANTGQFPSKIDRKSFNAWRKMFWKERVKYLRPIRIYWIQRKNKKRRRREL